MYIHLPKSRSDVARTEVSEDHMRYDHYLPGSLASHSVHVVQKGGRKYEVKLPEFTQEELGKIFDGALQNGGAV